jgi:hypothetical protein
MKATSFRVWSLRDASIFTLINELNREGLGALGPINRC